jgi:hypothetical protein
MGLVARERNSRAVWNGEGEWSLEDYRLEDETVLLATRIEGAAIFTSTCSIGFFVQACVT